MPHLSHQDQIQCLIYVKRSSALSMYHQSKIATSLPFLIYISLCQLPSVNFNVCLNISKPTHRTKLSATPKKGRHLAIFDWWCMEGYIEGAEDLFPSSITPCTVRKQESEDPYCLPNCTLQKILEWEGPMLPGCLFAPMKFSKTTSMYLLIDGFPIMQLKFQSRVLGLPLKPVTRGDV